MLKLTFEQSDILDIDLLKFAIIIIQALAGTGKTTTSLELVKKHPELHFALLAFNNNIIKETKRKTSSKLIFPNVEVRTLHSFASKYTVSHFTSQGKILENTLTFDLVKSLLGDLKTFEIYSTIRWFNLYCNQELNFFEYKKFIKGLTNRQKYDLQIHERKDYILKILKNVEFLYTEIVYGESTFFTHGVYFKFFIDNIENFSFDDIDVLLIDEAQDLNPVMLKLVLSFIKKGKKFIGVGDDNQSIYSFLNNINLLSHFEKNTDSYNILVKQLTKSFRFPSNSIMEKYSNLILNYRGKNIEGVSTNTDTNIEDVLFIGRSNAQVLWTAFELSLSKKEFLLIGGISSDVQSFIEDIYYISVSKTEKVKSKLLKSFNNFDELKIFAFNENVQEIISVLTLLKKLNTENIELFYFFKNIKKFNKNIHFIKARQNPTFLSTIHKAKGLEFDEVIMIPKLSENILPVGFKNDISINNFKVVKILSSNQIIEELNLLYVAFTRAKKELTISNDEVLLNIKFLQTKLNFKEIVTISDKDLEKSNFGYISNEFYKVSFDSYNFLINKEELIEYKKIITIN